MWFCYVWYVLLSASTSLSKKSCSSILKAKLSPAQKCITLFQLKRGLHTSILDILDFVGSNAGSVALGKVSFTCKCRVSEMVLMSSPKGKFGAFFVRILKFSSPDQLWTWSFAPHESKKMQNYELT